MFADCLGVRTPALSSSNVWAGNTRAFLWWPALALAHPCIAPMRRRALLKAFYLCLGPSPAWHALSSYLCLSKFSPLLLPTSSLCGSRVPSQTHPHCWNSWKDSHNTAFALSSYLVGSREMVSFRGPATTCAFQVYSNQAVPREY